VHDDAHGPLQPPLCLEGVERVERGEIATVVTREHGARRGGRVGQERAHGRALVDRERRTQLARHARRIHLQPELRTECLDLGRDRLPRVARGAPVNRERDLTLPFDEQLGPAALGLDRGGGDSFAERERRGIDDRRAVDPTFEPVLAHEFDPVDRDRSRQEIERAATDDADDEQALDQRVEHRERFRGRGCLRGVDDDRRERSVEVEEERSRLRSRCQHVDHCAGRDHGGTLARVDASEAARTTIAAHEQDLVALSHRIHAHPELCFEETRSSAWTAGVLADGGLDVETGVGGLDTAFVARAGSGPLHLAICAEYDALPGIGHACGHNIIAAAAAGAGLALAPIADDLGLTVSVIGTPAEEGGGGKIYLLEAGVFDGIHAAMMVHPASVDVLRPRVSAVSHFIVEYTGRGSHAAAAPQLGVNAADAFVVAQVAIGLLRQHLRSTDQVHGFVTHGGDAANIIPARATGDWMVRALDLDELLELLPRVQRCFESGALATGAKLHTEDVCPPYSHMVHDDDLVELYRRNAQALGRSYGTDDATFSTDMGNVSLAIPSIHPTIAIESAGAVIHQPEFAAAAVNASADRAVVEGALALALTAIGASRGPLRERLLTEGSRRRDAEPAQPPMRTTQS